MRHSRNRIRAWVGAAALVAPALGGVGCASPAFHGFRTSDGFTIAADLHLPEGAGPAPLVVLGHQLDRDRHSWDPLVPRLTERGYAVLALDHRGFGESTKEAASPADLTPAQRDSLVLDFLGAIDAVRHDPRVDPSRVILMASGLSVGAAVQCAEQNTDVRALVLLPGLIDQDGRDWLLLHPDFPLLLISAQGETKGRNLVRQYTARFTGPAQESFEIEPTSSDAATWEGTDGLTPDTGVIDLILWFLDRRCPATGR
jgi:pimeloyl-ACP methyl ester carboxylesterase